MDEVAVWLFTHGLQGRDAHIKMLGWNADMDRAWKKHIGIQEAEDTALSFLPENAPDWLIEEASHMTTCQFLTGSSPQAKSWLRMNNARQSLGFETTKGEQNA